MNVNLNKEFSPLDLKKIDPSPSNEKDISAIATNQFAAIDNALNTSFIGSTLNLTAWHHHLPENEWFENIGIEPDDINKNQWLRKIGIRSVCSDPARKHVQKMVSADLQKYDNTSNVLFLPENDINYLLDNDQWFQRVGTKLAHAHFQNSDIEMVLAKIKQFQTELKKPYREKLSVENVFEPLLPENRFNPSQEKIAKAAFISSLIRQIYLKERENPKKRIEFLNRKSQILPYEIFDQEKLTTLFRFDRATHTLIDICWMSLDLELALFVGSYLEGGPNEIHYIPGENATEDTKYRMVLLADTILPKDDKSHLLNENDWFDKLRTRLILLFRPIFIQDPNDQKYTEINQKYVDPIMEKIKQMMGFLKEAKSAGNSKANSELLMSISNSSFAPLFADESFKELTKDQKFDIQACFIATLFRDLRINFSSPESNKAFNRERTRFLTEIANETYGDKLKSEGDIINFFRFKLAIVQLQTFFGPIQSSLPLKVGNLLDGTSDTKRYILGGRHHSETKIRIDLIESMNKSLTNEGLKDSV